MTSKERFLAAANCQTVDRPPIWIMRQAGRYLPEYRKLKEQYDFVTMVKTPELATEVTLQPLKRFALDAAIVFSDILIVPEALGQPYYFREEGGIGMDFRLETAADIEKLAPASVVSEKLAYIADALRLVDKEVGADKAVLGFAGSPWTLACYMVEGGSSKDFTRIKALFYEDRKAFESLMTKLASAVAELLKMQLAAGADCVQLFDSWAAACAGTDYHDMSLRWIRQIIDELPVGAPIILFAKGMAHHVDSLAASGAKVLGMDWTVDLPRMRELAPANIALQGNLDPTLLSTTPDIVHRAAKELLTSMNNAPGHIVNLGHGILPSAHVECVETLVNTVVAANGN
ncbi:uroporphyrinogen decarboxylase [Cerasicoccus arenae]|uniref:Uroporphyrinogen decarboxylase n=1 Tax=Cerasicoccus arenae TaxID=424488 RepID=A0A8J3GED8_9BACT|nr:uroporphyrinogen decarboxylase [Cerasicoccus arenae]MBK1859571.1 uroporphyrinogen decarboxylase [Cerasicoccus arenae]GHC03039.1 uroporphyrinogen decarboxylase [Cerasicoccus arenae]